MISLMLKTTQPQLSLICCNGMSSLRTWEKRKSKEAGKDHPLPLRFTNAFFVGESLAEQRDPSLAELGLADAEPVGGAHVARAPNARFGGVPRLEVSEIHCVQDLNFLNWRVDQPFVSISERVFGHY